MHSAARLLRAPGAQWAGRFFASGVEAKTSTLQASAGVNTGKLAGAITARLRSGSGCIVDGIGPSATYSALKAIKIAGDYVNEEFNGKVLAIHPVMAKLPERLAPSGRTSATMLQRLRVAAVMPVEDKEPQELVYISALPGALSFTICLRSLLAQEVFCDAAGVAVPKEQWRTAPVPETVAIPVMPMLSAWWAPLINAPFLWAVPLSDELLSAAKVGPAGKAKAKKAAAKKKVAAADLAQQMSLLTSMLPQLAEQLTSVKERQDALNNQVATGSKPDQSRLISNHSFLVTVLVYGWQCKLRWGARLLALDLCLPMPRLFLWWLMLRRVSLRVVWLQRLGSASFPCWPPLGLYCLRLSSCRPRRHRLGYGFILPVASSLRDIWLEWVEDMGGVKKQWPVFTGTTADADAKRGADTNPGIAAGLMSRTLEAKGVLPVACMGAEPTSKAIKAIMITEDYMRKNGTLNAQVLTFTVTKDWFKEGTEDRSRLLLRCSPLPASELPE
ncbi:hypothetical protein AK812_SmicGene1041 [Symbiodinium microadriaticum]|uniref:Uncharacterized protein n=1 Tax=Symbiodinium microadriaticum TaxID=2951 RepID=A0A1Q9F4W7_SYMMI|nr:hypothetical protein AK812_SmicGene1041 [Symbiodinium microadriaticum]